jgi:hypothetical protein
MASSLTKSEPTNFYLWGVLKDKVYSNNPCTDNNLKRSIQDVVS